MVDLCREYDPSEVVNIERQWGEYLLSKHDYEMAVDKFIQCGDTKKAIQSALFGRHLEKAADLLQNLVCHLEHNISSEISQGDETYHAFHLELAEAFREKGRLKRAETHFCLAGCPAKAIEMYKIEKKWDAFHRLVTQQIPLLEQTVDSYASTIHFCFD